MKQATPPWVQQCWRDYRAQSTAELRNFLVEHYFPIVKINAEVVKNKLPDVVDVNDLIAAGVFGLIDAIEAFDLDRGVKFETYCVLRIRGAMFDELRTMDWVPRLVRSQARKLEAARREIEVATGREPTEDELADLLGLTREECHTRKRAVCAVTMDSIDQQWGTSEDAVRGVDVLVNPKGDSSMSGMQEMDVLRLVTKGLNRHERLIIILYYWERLPMREIGQTIGLSESRVSQMLTSIVKRLKEKCVLSVREEGEER
jgi:RNA polymerase sigma factor for flagellar operon FliA